MENKCVYMQIGVSMVINIAICDDDIAAITHVQDLLATTMEEEYRLLKFESGEKLDFYIDDTQTADVHLIFLDINLITQNGIDLAGKLKEKFPEVKVIFISGNVLYCQDIFDVQPTCFLIKPIQKEKLIHALELALDKEPLGSENAIAVQTKTKILKIPLIDILYIESKLRKVSFVTKKETFEVYAKLGDIAQKLPDNFVRCHNSYIANLDTVEFLNGNTLHLYNGRTLVVSKTYQKEVKEAFVGYLGGLL